MTSACFLHIFASVVRVFEMELIFFFFLAFLHCWKETHMKESNITDLWFVINFVYKTNGNHWWIAWVRACVTPLCVVTLSHLKSFPPTSAVSPELLLLPSPTHSTHLPRGIRCVRSIHYLPINGCQIAATHSVTHSLAHSSLPPSSPFLFLPFNRPSFCFGFFFFRVLWLLLFFNFMAISPP